MHDDTVIKAELLWWQRWVSRVAETGRPTVPSRPRLHRRESGPNPNVKRATNPAGLHRTNNKLRPTAPNLGPSDVSALNSSKTIRFSFKLIAYIYACNPSVLSPLVSNPGLDFFPVDQSFNRALSAWALSKVKVLCLSFVVVFRWEWGREEPPSRWLATSPLRRYQRHLDLWHPSDQF